MSAVTGRVAYLLGPERIEWRQDAVPEPGPGEVLLRVGAAVTCGTDLKVFRQGGHARMLRPPNPFGHEVAGTIAALGAQVIGWRAGDRVAVANSASCGACPPCREGRENLCEDLRYLNGAFAEWLLLPRRFVERSLHRCPEGLSFAIAALAEPLACVLHGSELCALPAGHRALVLGAGPIGLLWTGVLAAAGHHVVLGDPNPERLDIGRRFGAAQTVRVERHRADSAGGGRSANGAGNTRRETSPWGGGFDAAIDCTASAAGFDSCATALRAGGLACVFAGPPAETRVGLDLHDLHYREIQVRGVYHYRPSDYVRALDLLAQARLPADLLISERLPLDQLETALRRMMARTALKVALIPG